MKRIAVLLALLLCFLPLWAIAEPEETDTPADATPVQTADTLASPSPAGSPSPSPTAEETPAFTPSPAPSASPVKTPEPTPLQTVPAASATVTPVPASFSGLRIDSETVFDEMSKSYSQGYVPSVSSGRVSLVLPLLGKTANGQVVMSLDLGEPSNSPFVFGNYSQTEKEKDGLYLFRFSIPLAKGRINGHYPILCKAEYLNENGVKSEQTFTLYVTVTDGKNPPDPNAVTQETARFPELYIRSCSIQPQTVTGGETFGVHLEIENIGNIRARNVKMTVGSETETIRAESTQNSQLLENLDPGDTVSAQFSLTAGADTLSGWHAFHIILEYRDAYGGSYTTEQTYSIEVTQPAEYSYDTPTVPKEIHAGETFTLPANVFNTGKSTLKQVTVSVEGTGLYPSASAYLGDLPAGQAGYGEIHVFAGFLSTASGSSERYGMTTGRYTVSFLDEMNEEHAETVEFGITILAPEVQTTPAPSAEPDAAVPGSYRTSLWIGLAIIVALASWIVTAQVLRKVQIGAHMKK